MTAAPAACDSVRVLRPRQGMALAELRQLWRFRELTALLAWRDVKVRYKQTALGALWAIIQPVTMMVILSVLFGRLANFQQHTGGSPYPIFFYAGMLPWTFFAAAVTASSGSLVSNAGMLRKIYFPRLILPLSAVGAPLVDYAVAFLVLVGLMVWYGVMPSLALLLLPLLIALSIIAALGVGVALAAVTVKHRDFRHVVPFLIQVWFFITPVIYPVTVVPEKYRWLLSLNPMSGTIEGFRAVVLGHAINWTSLAQSGCVGGLCLMLGVVYFSRVERRFADVV